MQKNVVSTIPCMLVNSRISRFSRISREKWVQILAFSREMKSARKMESLVNTFFHFINTPTYGLPCPWKI